MLTGGNLAPACRRVAVDSRRIDARSSTRFICWSERSAKGSCHPLSSILYSRGQDFISVTMVAFETDEAANRTDVVSRQLVWSWL